MSVVSTLYDQVYLDGWLIGWGGGDGLPSTVLNLQVPAGYYHVQIWSSQNPVGQWWIVDEWKWMLPCGHWLYN
jgi:hypothetical protein